MEILKFPYTFVAYKMWQFIQVIDLKRKYLNSDYFFFGGKTQVIAHMIDKY